MYQEKTTCEIKFHEYFCAVGWSYVVIFTYVVACRSVSELRLDNINGFILNIPSDYKIGGFIPLNFNRKHWITVRKVGDTYYNLDSKLKTPAPLGMVDAVLPYLRTQLSDQDRELLIVVSQEVQQSAAWKTGNPS